jgi:18S rRNA (guanine1575-N7)-methyltransferase
LNKFFSSLYAVLKKDARAILQFYPETSEQAVIIAQAASKVGFAGGIVVDYPNSSKAKKYYLCLSFERTFKMPTAMGVGESSGVEVGSRQRQVPERRSNKPQRLAPKSAEWIKNKKDQRRKAGKEVKSDSKFSGRKRPTSF